MAADDLIVIAKSAPDNRPGYCLNLLNCHCYPAGLPMQFTYRKRYIDLRLLQHGEEGLKGRKVLILFCDQPSGKPDFKYIPLRFATFRRFAPKGVLDVADDDTRLVVEVLLGNYVNADPASGSTQPDDWQKWFENQCPTYRPLPPGHPDENARSRWVVPTANLPEPKDERSTSARWISLSERLATSQSLKDCNLFRVAGIARGVGEQADSVPLVQQGTQPLVELKSGVTYSLRLEFY